MRTRLNQERVAPGLGAKEILIQEGLSQPSAEITKFICCLAKLENRQAMAQSEEAKKRATSSHRVRVGFSLDDSDSPSSEVN